MNISINRSDSQISLCTFFIAFCFSFLLMRKETDAYSWQKPGCHKLGFTRTVRIPGCVTFEMTSNACRGYCTSFSIPSTEKSLQTNPNQLITSASQCCNIMETEDVIARVECYDGQRNFVFKSAKTCGCFECKKY